MLIGQGAQGELVSRIQAILLGLGDTSIIIDGIYGSKTAQSVRNFQSKLGLTITGLVDDTTYNKLMSLATAAQSGQAVLSILNKEIISGFRVSHALLTGTVVYVLYKYLGRR